jgi:ComEC/Rec2-related protein
MERPTIAHWILLGFCLGCVGLTLSLNQQLMALAVLCIIACCVRNDMHIGIITCICCSIPGGYYATWRNRQITCYPIRGTSVHITGSVASEPKKETTWNYVLDVASGLTADEKPCTYRAYAKSRDQPPRIGQTFSGIADVQAGTARNGRSTYGRQTYLTARTLKPMEQDNPPTMSDRLLIWRVNREHVLAQRISGQASSFAQGLIFGTRANFSDETRAVLIATGTMHLVAISGANISFLVIAARRIFFARRLRSQAAVTVGTAAIISVLTGSGPSVVRGGLAVSIQSLVKLVGLPQHRLGSILLCAGLMLLYQPDLITRDISFQLSFSAYLGVVYLQKPIEKALTFARIPRFLRSLGTETLAATMATSPISYLHFGRFGFLGLLCNPTVLWIIPFVTTLCWITALSPDIIGVPIGWLVDLVLSNVLRWFEFVAQIAGAVPP